MGFANQLDNDADLQYYNWALRTLHALPSLESKSSWIVDGVDPGVNGKNLATWVEDSDDLTAMLQENAVVSPPASLFSQPDVIDSSTVVEVLFELSELSHATIEQAVNSVVENVNKMTTQEVL